MRSSLAFLVIAGMASTVLAAASLFQPGGQPTKPSTPPPTLTLQPPAPAPAAVPVPDGPAINKQELEGGLVVEDIKIGDGYEVKEKGVVVAHYHGTIKADGKVFQSSFQTGKPYATTLTDVIAGWSKGIPGMKVGGVRKLTIPAKLAYAEHPPQGSDIPPNSDLVFIIQIVDALEVTDVKVGTGEAATGRCIPVTAHVTKDAEGKELEKYETSSPYVWLPGEMNAPGTMFDTMQQAIEGMKVGGKRLVKIPAAMNGAPPQLEVKRPSGVPISIELELVAVRNLPGQPGRR